MTKAPLAIAFGLIGALLAFGMMRLMETDWLDPVAFHAGVAAATVFGALAAALVQVLRKRPRLSRVRWLFVPLAGALVGMTVQAVLLRAPVHYTATVGLTKAHPVSWVLAGAPLGAIPAVLATILLALSLRFTGPIPPLDARERMIVPLASACMVLGSIAIFFAHRSQVPALFGIVLLAGAALVEIAVRDTSRMRFLRRVFENDTKYEVVPLAYAPQEDVPEFAAGVRAELLILPLPTETGYRVASRRPLASTGGCEGLAVAPLRGRRLFTSAVVATSFALAVAALLLQ